MLPTVDHPRLKRSAVEARAYQLEGVAEALECSTLLVYPTAAGKTAVSAMVVAEVISDGGRAVMLAPTVGLVEQHKSTLTNWLRSFRLNTYWSYGSGKEEATLEFINGNHSHAPSVPQ